MVALLALRVGAQRAVESAVSVLPDDDIAAIGPLLQSVALPPSTREEIRQDKELLKELRAALVERLPEADVEPQRITRFGGRTILTLVLVIAAVTALVTSFNFDQIATAVTEANPWFAVLSFALGILTWVGAALTLAAFSPSGCRCGASRSRRRPGRTSRSPRPPASARRRSTCGCSRSAASRRPWRSPPSRSSKCRSSS